MGKKQSLNKIYAKYINGDDYLISNAHTRKDEKTKWVKNKA